MRRSSYRVPGHVMEFNNGQIRKQRVSPSTEADNCFHVETNTGAKNSRNSHSRPTNKTSDSHHSQLLVSTSVAKCKKGTQPM